ncbi:hypothetical protein ACFLRM_04655 [Acidobacteriota bacterium]
MTYRKPHNIAYESKLLKSNIELALLGKSNGMDKLRVIILTFKNITKNSKDEWLKKGFAHIFYNASQAQKNIDIVDLF